MITLIRKHLLDIVDNIDSGNSNITEDQGMLLIEMLSKFTDTKDDFSKYSAANYLNVSRATFDNYISEGKIPKGKKKQGFKELRWYKKDLDNFIKKYRHSNTLSL